ncbi:sodium/hydrogen exchanger [Desulfovibrio ferrophilus]|uniref:Sodium/hydrogen exchanger n=2 Tax=Desulfovibrio ferrophilus TaxID=241368 RepID=A0A2Z6B3U8_9BACT|nr:sodium/hydrogen exchanger [Desulfovibrio ferrophilus]
MILDQAWTLMLICLAAVILPGLSRLLRLPEVALQILFGVLLGKSVLHLEIEGHFLPFLAELGFLMLMFQAGMELDFGAMSRQSKGRMAFQGLLFGVTFALAIGAAMALDQGVFTALILTTTSLGLVVPSLKEAGIIRSDLGQSVLLAATVADFMTLFGITFYVLWMLHGMSWQLIAPLPFFILVGILLKLARLWAWWNPDKAAQALAADDAQEFGVRLSLALLFLLVALSEVVHLEPVLGAFIGGAVLAFVFRERMALETKLSGMAYGFFIPMFFIHVGMQFDVTNIATPERLAMTGVLLLVALGVKLVPGLMLRLLGYGWRESVAAGLLLASRLSLIIAAASIGLDYGLVTPEFKDSIVLLAVCTCLLGPTLFKLVMPRRSTPP